MCFEVKALLSINKMDVTNRTLHLKCVKCFIANTSLSLSTHSA